MIHLSAHAPFEIAFTLAMPHGLVAGLHLPGGSTLAPPSVPEDVLERLHPDDAAHARTLHGFRQNEFVGGRLALGVVFQELGLRPTSIPQDVHGAPVLPAGLVGSITHKKDLAVAIVARTPGSSVATLDKGGSGDVGASGPSLGIGIDLEDLDRAREGIAERVLRPEELEAVAELPGHRKWVDVATRFALKEAVYKGLHPFVQRYVGFAEASVRTSPDGTDEVTLHLTDAEGPYVVDARHTWIEGPGAVPRVLATVRIRPA